MRTCSVVVLYKEPIIIMLLGYREIYARLVGYNYNEVLSLIAKFICSDIESIFYSKKWHVKFNNNNILAFYSSISILIQRTGFTNE